LSCSRSKKARLVRIFTYPMLGLPGAVGDDFPP
jgi:hypothetical protein